MLDEERFDTLLQLIAAKGYALPCEGMSSFKLNKTEGIEKYKNWVLVT